MNEIWNYILALLVVAIIRWLLPKFKTFVNWLILKLVYLMEKLIKGSKLGVKKKKCVLKILRIFGIKSTKVINELIDLAVDTMNNKQDDIQSDIKDNISDKLESGIDKITNK